MKKSSASVRLRGLQKQIRALKSSNKELGQFAAYAAHDLKEPLRKMISFGELLVERFGQALEGVGLDYLNRIIAASQRMKSLVDALLAYAALDKKEKSPETVHLGPMVKYALGDLEKRVIETDAQVEVAELPKVRADHLQMKLLFSNLLSNALKFHKTGEPPRVKIFAKPASKGKVTIVVEDAGIGFEKKYQKNIFEPFWKLHSRDEYEGTGLGLAICRKIVLKHGGTMSGEGTPGKGSRFSVTLPTAKA